MSPAGGFDLDAPLTLRPLAEHDLPLLHDWLQRPHLAQWWGAPPTLAEVQQDYRPDTLARHGVTPYIALLGDAPVAYAQSYVALGSGEGWWEDETDPGVRGIDQSIAEPSLLNQGLGTRLVRALVERLFSDPAVTRVQTDPSPDNPRAIACYLKAGFRIARPLIHTPDGPAVYMLRERA